MDYNSTDILDLIEPNDSYEGGGNPYKLKNLVKNRSKNFNDTQIIMSAIVVIIVLWVIKCMWYRYHDTSSTKYVEYLQMPLDCSKVQPIEYPKFSEKMAGGKRITPLEDDLPRIIQGY